MSRGRFLGSLETKMWTKAREATVERKTLNSASRSLDLGPICATKAKWQALMAVVRLREFSSERKDGQTFICVVLIRSSCPTTPYSSDEGLHGIRGEKLTSTKPSFY